VLPDGTFVGHCERMSGRRATRIVRWLVEAMLLAGVAIDGVLTASGHFEYVAGGDCGGKSCVNSGYDKGIRNGFVLLVAALTIAAWPLLVRRYKLLWGES
jgi:hypothetical protein